MPADFEENTAGLGALLFEFLLLLGYEFEGVLAVEFGPACLPGCNPRVAGCYPQLAPQLTLLLALLLGIHGRNGQRVDFFGWLNLGLPADSHGVFLSRGFP